MEMTERPNISISNFAIWSKKALRIVVIHPICQYERFGNRALFGLSEGPDYLIVYLSELRFINPRSDTSEFWKYYNIFKLIN
jgi:hypothetical protein